MAAGVSIRDAVPADAGAIEALWDAAYATSSSRSSVQDLPILLSHGPSARLLLAVEDDVILGTLIVTFDGWRGNMYRLAVLPESQRKGVATSLVREAHEWLLSVGCRRITALVEGDHDYAAGFWESVGYSHDGSMRRYHLNIEA